MNLDSGTSVIIGFVLGCFYVLSSDIFDLLIYSKFSNHKPQKCCGIQCKIAKAGKILNTK